MNKNTIEPDLNEEDLKDTLFNDSFAMSGEEMALTLDHLNHQLQQLSDIIKTYNQIHFKDKASQLDCICALIERVIPEGSRKMLLHAIRETGYENIQKAFIALNQVCEDINHEKEDLFFILKRHRLNFPVPKEDSMRLYRFGQFLNVTLIHYHMQKKRGFRLTDLQQKIKWESALTLKPVFDRLIRVLKMVLPAEHGKNLKGMSAP